MQLTAVMCAAMAVVGGSAPGAFAAPLRAMRSPDVPQPEGPAIDCSSLPNIPCTLEYLPLCGSDGVTYGNKCAFKVAQCTNPDLQLAAQGECAPAVDVEVEVDCSKGPAIPCTLEYLPLCGSDGVTYGNKCAFKVAQCDDPELTIVSDGECDAVPAADGNVGYQKEELVVDCTQAPAIPCTAEYVPVCGSDNVSYGNLCMFKAAQCTNPELTMVSEGECGSAPAAAGEEEEEKEVEVDCSLVPAIQCTREYSPICGSDGVTYSNMCMLKVAQCADESLAVVAEGECEAKN